MIQAQERSYKLHDVAQLLGVNPKTLARWVAITDVHPQAGALDRRQRLISQQQLEEIARKFGRPLPDGLPAHEEQSMLPEINVSPAPADDGTAVVSVDIERLQRLLAPRLEPSIERVATRVADRAVDIHEQNTLGRTRAIEADVDMLARVIAHMLHLDTTGPAAGIVRQLQALLPETPSDVSRAQSTKGDSLAQTQTHVG